MRRRSGFTSRRPNLDVLESRNLLSGVILGLGTPMPPPIVVIVGRAPFPGPTFDSDPRVMVSRTFGSASGSWNPAGFGDGQGGWGGAFHHGFAGSSLSEKALRDHGPHAGLVSRWRCPRGLWEVLRLPSIQAPDLSTAR